MRIIRWTMLASVFVTLISFNATAGSKAKHFDPKGKAPSSYTIEFQKHQRAILPFEDRRDFEEMKRGFIAAPQYRQIMADAGHVAWDMGKYDFLLEPGQTFDDQIKAGKARFDGNREIFDRLRASMTDFDPFFEMMPGTAGKTIGEGPVKPMEVEPRTVDPNID